MVLLALSLRKAVSSVQPVPILSNEDEFCKRGSQLTAPPSPFCSSPSTSFTLYRLLHCSAFWRRVISADLTWMILKALIHFLLHTLWWSFSSSLIFINWMPLKRFEEQIYQTTTPKLCLRLLCWCNRIINWLDMIHMTEVRVKPEKRTDGSQSAINWFEEEISWVMYKLQFVTLS